MVDFPTPEEPSNTMVCPRARYFSNSSNPWPVFALSAYGDTHGDSLYFLYFSLGVVANIRLVQNNHRFRTGLPTLRQVALDAAWTKIAIESGNKKRRVHIGRNHLLGDLGSRRFTDKPAVARKNFVNLRGASLVTKFHC